MWTMTRTSALVLAAALAASPALAAEPGGGSSADTAADGGGIHEDKDTKGTFDQPYVPGYNQSPEADVRAKSAPSVGDEEQQANALPDEPVPGNPQASWDQRDQFVTTAGDAVDYWKGKVDQVDPETVRLDELKKEVGGLAAARDMLRESESGTWTQDRDAFNAQLYAVREAYVELPAARKSQAASKEPAEENASGPAVD